MLVLGIETSCDDTACALVRNGNDILSSIITSQGKIHEQFGGVFPEMAGRAHVDAWIPTLSTCLETAEVNPQDIDLIAVTQGPGLIGSLVMGINGAKALALAWNKPLIAINHIEAHLYSAVMHAAKEVVFPAIGVVLSGGHTLLTLMHDVCCHEPIGSTVDDAIGEAFDKVACMLGLPYPGGPHIERIAALGSQQQFTFKRGVVKNNAFAFSFSGLKTNVLYTIKGQDAKTSASSLTDTERQNIAASFQHAAFMDVVEKTLKAAKLHSAKSIIFGGGVTNNNQLRSLFQELTPNDFSIFFPKKELSLDNAAMIAGLGYHQYQKDKQSSSLHFEAYPRTTLSSGQFAARP